MTRQFNDTLSHRGRKYEILEAEGGNLYQPPMPTHPPSSACSKGFLCHYRTTEQGQLLLTQLQVTVKDGVYPTLDGVTAVTYSQEDVCRDGFYSGLSIPLSRFSGRLMLGTDIILPLPYHSSESDATGYNSVLEVHFQNGWVTQEMDLTKQVADRRKLNEERGSLDDYRPFSWSFDRYLQAKEAGEISDGDENDL